MQTLTNISRSRGYDPGRRPAVTIRLQDNGTGRLDAEEVYRLLRKLRRRYGNTSGVQYEAEVSRRA